MQSSDPNSPAVPTLDALRVLAAAARRVNAEDTRGYNANPPNVGPGPYGAPEVPATVAVVTRQVPLGSQVAPEDGPGLLKVKLQRLVYDPAAGPAWVDDPDAEECWLAPRADQEFSVGKPYHVVATSDYLGLPIFESVPGGGGAAGGCGTVSKVECVAGHLLVTYCTDPASPPPVPPPANCPAGTHYDDTKKGCVPDPGTPCPPGTTYDGARGVCYPDCTFHPSGVYSFTPASGGAAVTVYYPGAAKVGNDPNCVSTVSAPPPGWTVVQLDPGQTLTQTSTQTTADAQ